MKRTAQSRLSPHSVLGFGRAFAQRLSAGSEQGGAGGGQRLRQPSEERLRSQRLGLGFFGSWVLKSDLKNGDTSFPPSPLPRKVFPGRFLFRRKVFSSVRSASAFSPTRRPPGSPAEAEDVFSGCGRLAFTSTSPVVVERSRTWRSISPPRSSVYCLRGKPPPRLGRRRPVEYFSRGAEIGTRRRPRYRNRAPCRRGKSMAGLKSTPVKSRITLSYSTSSNGEW